MREVLYRLAGWALVAGVFLALALSAVACVIAGGRAEREYTEGQAEGGNLDG